MSLRVVFMGTPEYGVPSLEALLAAGYDVAGVFCQPDKPSGRGNKITFCPVKQCALAHGLPVFQPLKTRVDGVAPLRELAPDVCVTAAFGHILSQEVLDIPRIGTVNVHASLLPKYRGSAPVNWALIRGETVTGVTTMLTDKGLDTGDILMRREVAVLPDETAGELIPRLAKVGAELLIETLRALENGACPREKQNEDEATYFPLLKKEMGKMDFTKPAKALCDFVRGMTPWPGATAGPFKVLAAQAVAYEGSEAPGTILTADAKRGLLVRAGAGAVRLARIQAPGGKPMNDCDYLRGHPLTAGGNIAPEEHHAE
ncbi:MAG: methionyl-tRNA formyltransferase [Clostridia bacterium]|nr:methionyl-tRNA formyltransferase [Clostridia bacterium]